MNIEMHGLSNEQFERVGERICRQLSANLSPEAIKDWAVTHVPSRSFNITAKPAPFLRVYSDRKSDLDIARKLLKPIRLPGLKTKKVIEFVLLAECS